MRHSSNIQSMKSPVLSSLRVRRSGALMVELMVGAILLGVFIGTVGPMFRWIHESKRSSERHLIAMQELSTQMERLAALPSSVVTSEALESLAISESTVELLPDSQLTATMSPDSGMQRVTLTMSWINEAGMEVEPKQLTAWFPLESGGNSE